MTQVTMEILEAGGFEGIIKEGAEAFDGDRGEANAIAAWPCFVHHRDAGGRCERGATMEAYDIPFCEVHGAEIKAGILAEIYHDAGNVLEDASASEDTSMNPASWVHLDGGRWGMVHRCVEAEKAQAAALVDIYFSARMHTLRLMRLSWSAGQHWMLEVLEEEREGASAQLAFALARRAQKTGQAV